MGEEGRSSGHKLNITDGFTGEIIPSNIPSVILSVKSVMSPDNLSV
jgi:hypothetical protein